MSQALLSVREIVISLQREVIPFIRKDVYNLIEGVGTSRRYLSNELRDEVLAKGIVYDIVQHCLLCRLPFTRIKSRPQHRLFDMIDSNYLPNRYMGYQTQEEIDAIYQRVSQQFRVTDFSEDLHLDIMETLFDRHFFELNEKIGSFVGSNVWNLYHTQFKHGLVVITNTGEDYRISEFMRRHGHEYT